MLEDNQGAKRRRGSLNRKVKSTSAPDPSPMTTFATRESTRAWERRPQPTRSPLQRPGRAPPRAAPARGGQNARGGEAPRIEVIGPEPGRCAGRLDLCRRRRLRSLDLARAPRAQRVWTECALAHGRKRCAPGSASGSSGAPRAAVLDRAVPSAPRAAAPAFHHHSAARSPVCSAVAAGLPRCGSLPHDHFTAPPPRCPRGREGAARAVQSLEFRQTATGADEAAKDPSYVRAQSSSR